MRRWFLSYNSQDLGLMQSLEAALRRKDPGAQIYFAPKSVKAGTFWLPSLANEIAEATIFVLLVGEKGFGPWQVAEYYEAIGRCVKEQNFPVVLVLLEKQAAPGLPFLRQLHWIVTADPASEQTLAKLMDAAAGAGSLPSELWRYTAPYRGLAAMTEADSDFFFGRDSKTIEILKVLEAAPNQFPILLGNSGVGKSSLAQAGVLGALKRQAWPDPAGTSNGWPMAFNDSRRWCFLALTPGTEPIKTLVDAFLRTWQFDATDPQWEERQTGWTERLLDGRATLRGLLDATERRYEELNLAKAPAFLLYVDQGEELYVRSEERQRRRFSELIAQALGDPRLRGLMSLRADFFGELQKDEPLYRAHCLISVPPLREGELSEVVSRPAELLSARFETDHLAADIARRAAEESTKDTGALPLLSYLLDDMWTAMVTRGDGVLRLPPAAMELGGVLVERANTFLARNPHFEDALRRVLTLKLATVREDGEPTRRRAGRSEFSDEEWRLVSELADHPNRLLVTATPEGGEPYAEVAHETIFRRWDKLRNWIAAEREFLAWRTGMEAARRAWQATPDDSNFDAMLMGAPLTQARSWLAKRRDDLSDADRHFIDQSGARETRMRATARRVRALVYVLLVGIILGLIGWIKQSYVKEQWNWVWYMGPYKVMNYDPYVLKPEEERALNPPATFRECAKDCPEMIIVPAGGFMMGSPVNEKGRSTNEGPQHLVTIAKPFAVSKFLVTFADWDACASVGGCPQEGRAWDSGWGRGTQPVINVNWDDAQVYVAWLSKMTGKKYRLLSEAEWEYAARAGSKTAFYWGDEIGKGNANCYNCDSKWSQLRTSPVGSFEPNAFRLFDMAGNVWQWVQDCYNEDYNGAPVDGSAWETAECVGRVVRGGSWGYFPVDPRSAYRYGDHKVDRNYNTGFRVGRTLTP